MVEEHKIKRAAKLLLEKYGLAALPKVVAAASTCLEDGHKNEAQYWISVGEEIQLLQRQPAEELEDV